MRIWTSNLVRTVATAAHIRGPRSRTSRLNELQSGTLDGFTYKEVEREHPKEWKEREEDKLRYRYPKGEKN